MVDFIITQHRFQNLKLKPKPKTQDTTTVEIAHLVGFEQSVNSNNWSESQKYIANNVYVALEGSSCCGEKTAIEANKTLAGFNGLNFTFDENSNLVRGYIAYQKSQYPSGRRIGKENFNFNDLIIGVENDANQPNKATLGYKAEKGKITTLFINGGRDRAINNQSGDSYQEKKVAIPIDNSTQNETGNNQNLNFGTIKIRAIIANIDEIGNKYGSYGMKFSQSKLAEVDQAIQKLNTFVKQSSYGKMQLQWTTSGVHELGSGVCGEASYGDKVNALIQRALTAADSQSPLTDYSYYIIVHPMPDCPDGVTWSFEGRGQFKAFTLNGKIVHLRGVHISDLSDQYLFHEFGHSLAYQPNTGIGHPDYLNCPVTTSNGETKIALSNACPHVFNFSTGEIPIFTMMSTPSILSDYSAIEKEIAGWLTGSNIVTTTVGTYALSPLEESGIATKALKIPIAGTGYIVYVSFRQPSGYTYPDTPTNKPNGVILDITNGSGVSFLVTNNTNKNAPLQIGVSYRIGTKGPVITVNSISNNLASVTLE